MVKVLNEQGYRVEVSYAEAQAKQVKKLIKNGAEALVVPTQTVVADNLDTVIVESGYWSASDLDS